MLTYKGIDIDDTLRPLIRYMESVEEYREMLQNLQAVWDNLTLLGQLSGTGTDMSSTRQAFSSLTAALLHNLGVETRKKIVLEMESKAQVAVDIMVRNLFERTADIGFLATDDDIRQFCEFANEYGDNVLRRDEMRSRREALVARFQEYVRKYSVYHNIILLDTEGRVLAQLDPTNPVEHSTDPLIAESLATQSAYVETFHHTDLLPNQTTSLIYSYRVTSRDGATPLGVLCLCFRFENETERIFANLKSDDDWGAISLIDDAGTVIASSDAYHIPLGAKLEKVLDADCRVVRFAGREYLATTRTTKGYQGYMGPGWAGHVLVPITHAFTQTGAGRLDQVDSQILAGVMMSPTLFSEGLRSVPEQAEKIQRELNRSVWNGNVRQSSDKKAINPAFSKVLLWEISNTGLKTKDVFEHSIDNLHETVVSSILGDCQFLASLAIDIMDRNLYERSNDVRWWALTTAFRCVLGSPSVTPDARQIVTEVLGYINSLYTVYTNLVVFDANGSVVAASAANSEEFIGKVIDKEWVRRTLALKDTQSYTVSPFDPTSLYDSRHTYIYAAAIRALDDSNRVTGGIGIVFDATPQFDAMLRDALPRDERGEIRAGCFGVFIDRERRIIAATNPDITVGSLLDIADDFVCLANGKGFSNIIEYAGSYYAVGSKMSSGYREFKGPDDAYRNDVAALVFIPLGQVQSIEATQGRAREEVRMPHRSQPGADTESTEIATFHISGEWFGLPSAQVVEAIDAVGITPVPGMPDYVRGVVMFQGNPILVFDLKDHLRMNRPLDGSGYGQIVIARSGDNCFGILVHRLGEIPGVANNRIEPIANLFPGENVLAESVVKPEAGDTRHQLLLVLSSERIHQRLVKAKERLPDNAAPLRALTPGSAVA